MVEGNAEKRDVHAGGVVPVLWITGWIQDASRGPSTAVNTKAGQPIQPGTLCTWKINQQAEYTNCNRATIARRRPTTPRTQVTKIPYLKYLMM